MGATDFGAMRTFLTFILTCVGVLAANPPIVLNPWTTNRAPPVVGTNLGISNNASGFMWKFYGYPGSNTVARLMDLDPYALTNEAVVWHDTIYGNVWTNNVTFGVLFLSDAGNSAGSIVFSGDGNDVFKFVDLNLYTNLWCDSDFNTWQFDHLPKVGPYGTIGIPLLTNCAGSYISNSAGLGTNTSISNMFRVDFDALIVTNRNVGIGTNPPPAGLTVFNASPNIIQAGGPAFGTNAFSVSSNGQVTAGEEIVLTPVGGFAIRMTNNTGSNSVLGQLVSQVRDNLDKSWTYNTLSTNSTADVPVSMYEFVGVVAEGGKANGTRVLVTTHGRCWVLQETDDGAGGYYPGMTMTCSDTEFGKAKINVPSPSLYTNILVVHKIIGHSLTKGVQNTNGTNLVLCIIKH